MKDKNNISYPPIFASGQYYTKKDFQFSITAVNQTITHPTVLKNNNGITLLYFRNETGTIIVNSRQYPIKRGFLICLGSYHYFQLKPSNKPMELVQCRLSYDTFLYMAANPYYNFSEITLNVQPLTSLLEGDMLDRVEIVIEELIKATSKSRKKGNTKDITRKESIIDGFMPRSGTTEFFLCMRLMGILQKTNIKDFWS